MMLIVNLRFPTYNIENSPTELIMKNNCTNLYFLSTIACQLADCLDEKELEMLSTDLTVLGYMIESLLAHKNVCKVDSTHNPITNIFHN